MEQKILDLKQNIWRDLSVWLDGKLCYKNNKILSGDSNYHLLKVDIDGIVQDALAVCFIHHDQSVHLQKTMKKNKL